MPVVAQPKKAKKKRSDGVLQDPINIEKTSYAIGDQVLLDSECMKISIDKNLMQYSACQAMHNFAANMAFLLLVIVALHSTLEIRR